MTTDIPRRPPQMRIVHVIRDLDAISGGPSRSMPALVRALNTADQNVRVIGLFQDRNNETTTDASSPAFRSVSGGALGPIRLLALLGHLHGEHPIEILHLHGLWSPSIHLAARFARKHEIPYLVSPRGMLSTWCLGTKSLRKRIAWSIYQQKDLQSATCIHATSPSESSDIRASGLDTRLEIIPHGCEPPPAGTTHIRPPSKIVACIARLHPVKGLADLFEAWAVVRPIGWQMLIAGPDPTGYGRELHARIKRLKLSDSIRLIGTVDTAEKWDLLARAQLFVSASHSENFGMSILEALIAGTPVITTDATPWQSIADHEIGWWVPVGPQGIARALSEATSLQPSALVSMGRRAADFARRHYSWDVVAGRMISVYTSISATAVDRGVAYRGTEKS